MTFLVFYDIITDVSCHFTERKVNGMANSTYKTIMEKFDKAREDYAALLKQAEEGGKPLEFEGEKLNIIRKDLESITSEIDDNLHDQENFEATCAVTALLNAVNSALYSAENISNR